MVVEAEGLVLGQEVFGQSVEGFQLSISIFLRSPKMLILLLQVHHQGHQRLITNLQPRIHRDIRLRTSRIRIFTYLLTYKRTLEDTACSVLGPRVGECPIVCLVFSTACAAHLNIIVIFLFFTYAIKKHKFIILWIDNLNEGL